MIIEEDAPEPGHVPAAVTESYARLAEISLLILDPGSNTRDRLKACGVGWGEIQHVLIIVEQGIQDQPSLRPDGGSELTL